jgi:hypothetical protein
VHRGSESATTVLQESFIVDSWSASTPTECTPDSFGFEAVEGREAVAAFGGGAISSDAGALLLGATDRAINMMDRFAKLSRKAVGNKQFWQEIKQYSAPEIRKH